MIGVDLSLSRKVFAWLLICARVAPCIYWNFKKWREGMAAKLKTC
jgi:hypothetical protein